MYGRINIETQPAEVAVFGSWNLSLRSTLKNEPDNLGHNIMKILLQRKLNIYTIAWSDWAYASFGHS